MIIINKNYFNNQDTWKNDKTLNPSDIYRMRPFDLDIFCGRNERIQF